MSDWSKIDHRKQAVKDFVKRLSKPGNEQERADVLSNKCKARQVFAEAGGFEIAGAIPDKTKIPANMEIRVYEKNPPTKRDEDLGVMVLPEQLIGEPDVVEIWRCTWIDWTSLHEENRAQAEP